MIIQEIGEWHVEHFGNKGENPHIFRKLQEEFQEFMANPSSEECADIIIVLSAWAYRNGVDLDAAVRDKFDIVKRRDQLQRDIDRGLYNE